MEGGGERLLAGAVGGECDQLDRAEPLLYLI